MVLNDKQKRFCEEYLSTLDITIACIHSGIKLEIKPGNKYFVYFLVDADSNKIFYIGKGTKKRPFHHIREAKASKNTNAFKANRIKDILSKGGSVNVLYFATGIEENEAFCIEGSLIKAIGTHNLTNIQGGSSKATEKEKARYLLSKIIPFNRWVTQQLRTEEEIDIYFKIKTELTDIKENGLVVGLQIFEKMGKIVAIKEKRRA